MKKRGMGWVAAIAGALVATTAYAGNPSFLLTGHDSLSLTSAYYAGELYDSSTVKIFDGGSVFRLNSYDSSSISISGGRVNNLNVSNLRSGTENRITVTGGQVDALRPQITLTGDEHFSLTSSVTLSHLAPYGVQVTGGKVVSAFQLALMTYNSSGVSLSGGNISELDAFGTSSISVSGGSMNYLYAFETSNITISGGNILYSTARDKSRISISGGTFRSFGSWDTSELIISGGHFDNGFTSQDSSRVTISGGDIGSLYVIHDSIVNLIGNEFVLDDGLWLQGNKLCGQGNLSGQWLDGTPWTIEIQRTTYPGSIFLIPEPATILLLGLGGFVLRRKRCLLD